MPELWRRCIKPKDLDFTCLRTCSSIDQCPKGRSQKAPFLKALKSQELSISREANAPQKSVVSALTGPSRVNRNSFCCVFSLSDAAASHTDWGACAEAPTPCPQTPNATLQETERQEGNTRISTDSDSEPAQGGKQDMTLKHSAAAQSDFTSVRNAYASFYLTWQQ